MSEDVFDLAALKRLREYVDGKRVEPEGEQYGLYPQSGSELARIRRIHESQPPIAIMSANRARILCTIARQPYRPNGTYVQVGQTRVYIAELLS